MMSNIFLKIYQELHLIVSSHSIHLPYLTYSSCDEDDVNALWQPMLRTVFIL